MIAVVRTLLVTWVVLWSTSRQDVALHLIGWVVIGSGLAGYTRATWMTRFPYLVNFAEDASSELMEILPDNKALVLLFSFTLCAMASLFLAGAEHKSRGHAMRGAWLFFALSRIMFPISACGVDFNQDRPEAILVSLFSVLSFVGPLSSWPSRTYAIADIMYALMVQRSAGVCSGTESAVVATTLALAHDLVHMRFLHFLESTAYAVATVFILETTILVGFHRLSPRDESWNEALNLVQNSGNLESFLFTKAPPVLVTAWAVGMLLRTLTQGRMTLLELVGCVGLSGLFALAVLSSSKNPEILATRPSFACACAVVAMAASSRLSAGRRRVLKRNQYILASGFFPREIVTIEGGNGLGNGGANGVSGGGDFGVLSNAPESQSSREIASPPNENEFRPNPAAYTPRGAASSLVTVGSPSAIAAAAATEVSAEIRYEAALGQKRALEKMLFKKEALFKGHPAASEKDALKASIASLKEDRAKLEETIAMLAKQLNESGQAQ